MFILDNYLESNFKRLFGYIADSAPAEGRVHNAVELVKGSNDLWRSMKSAMFFGILGSALLGISLFSAVR